jgi:ATP-dependent Clp protease ATP-binding subunit ClpC
LTEKRGTLASRIPTSELTHALNEAVKLMQARKQHILKPELLLLAFANTPEVEAHRLLRGFSQERGFTWDNFVDDVDRLAGQKPAKDMRFDFVADDGQRVPLDNEMLTVLDEGLTLAEQRGATQCSSVHALAVMATIQIGAHWPLNRRGITKQAVLNVLESPVTATSTAKAVNHVALAQKKQLTPVYPRNDLLRNLINLLSMTTNRHVILTGEPGVGKRSLTLALANLIAADKGPAGLNSVVQINEPALLDDAYAAVQAGLRLAKGGVLFVPDIVRFFSGPRRYPDFPDRTCNELQKALLSDSVTIIGTASEKDFSNFLSKSSIIVEHCQQFAVPPATVPETVEILKTLGPTFESDYDLKIMPDSLAEAARLAGRYYTVEPLPGAAVHLLHRACALFKVDMEAEEGQGVNKDSQVDVEDVMKAASLLTGIPMAKMGADERKRYMNMADELHKRIIGQREAVQALSRAVKMARVGLKDPKRPIGSFMFLGPTGVGKTELAKALAEFMFATENALIALDMSEYMDDSSVNRLIGSPPGYVGHEAGGQLTDAVKKQPYSVVLFDEVEKASIKVFDVLLQVLDEGRLTSGQGETVSFSESVILMTSNIGSRFLADPDIDEAEARAAAEDAVKQHFRPEFLNRLDDIIFFHLLSDENLRDILTLLLRNEEKLLAGRGLDLDISDPAKTWLLAQNDHPEWGARPLRRIIQKHVREPMADFLLQEDPPPGVTIKIHKQGKSNQLKFTPVKPK